MPANKHILLLFLFAFCLSGNAQELVQREYRTRQGLSSNEVYEAISDSKGFMWFATNRGVCKFDGYRFTHFTIENGLSDNVILGLFEDHIGRIWCRSISGSISYVKNDSAFTISAKTKSYYPNSLLVNQNGSLLVGSQVDGIFNQIDFPYEEINNHTIFDTTFDLHIVKSKKGIMFSRSTRNDGRSILLDENTGEEIRFQIIPSASNARVITDGAIVVICSENYIYILDEQKQFHSYTLPFYIRNAYRDHAKNLWLCLGPNEGVAFYENSDLTKTPKIFLKEKTITSVTQDFENGYWMTTLNDGVKYVSTLDALEYDLTAVNKGSNQTTLRAMDFLVVANSLGNFIQIPSSESSSIATHNFLSNPEALPAGLKLVLKNKKMIEHDGAAVREVMPSPDYHYLREESELLLHTNPSYYWGTSTLTCFKADKQTNSILETYSSPSRINGSCVADDSTLILSCTNGLWSFRNGTFHEISATFPSLQHRLNDVQMDMHNNIWIASAKDGLFILEKESLIHLNRENGLTSNSCNNILMSDDSVYLATDNGISIITNYGTPQFKVTPLTSKQGLPGKIIKSIYDIRHDFYYVSDEGLFQYNHKFSEIHKTTPNIYISSFKVNGTVILTEKNLNLAHDENNISISFTGLSYLNPEGNLYKYKLDGIDQEWNQISSGQIQYPALPPGNYTFSVLAVNASDLESSEPAKISFVISQPFWQTWWFILGCVLLFIILTIWISLSRINRIKTRAKEQELINAKISRTEMRALQAQMNPHFIFNCINSIQHHILEQDKLVANKLLSKFSKLVRNVLENSNSEWISIQREIETLELYIEMESVRFSSQFNYTIVVDPNINTLLENIPPLIIQPFVENAIIHGLLPLDNQQGTLDIRLFKKEDTLICTIEDNGIGRERARQIKATKEQNYQSMGISITQERLNTFDLSGKHHRTMKLNIQDKSKNGEPSGTLVEIQLPINMFQ